MIYLDNGATSFYKPPGVARAVQQTMARCANPGRGGYPAAMLAAEKVFRCREAAAELFECRPEQVIFTANCTHGLNIAIRSLIKPGDRVLISGFEHNAVTRPLFALGAKVTVSGRRLFDREDTLRAFEAALKEGVDAAVFTHISNVFGYILPVERMASLCRKYGVPFVLDAAQSAGAVPVSLTALGAEFIAMPGHKGLLGPQGTGLLICRETGRPLLYGGTGSESRNPAMPDFLPDRLEAGTLNVPGIAGLEAGIRYILSAGVENIGKREHGCAELCGQGLEKMGFRVFFGPDQGATVSFLPDMDCEEAARLLAKQGIAVRAGLHCAPLAHESAGTLETGTVRISFGCDGKNAQVSALLRAVSKLSARKQ